MWGPYTRGSDKRQYLSIRYSDGSKSSLSYPKWLAENKYGIAIGDNHTHHIDNNPDNNDIKNLQSLSASDHAVLHRKKQREGWSWFACPMCKHEFQIRPSEYRRNQLVKGKAGPFCSRHCAGRYGVEIQFGLRKPGQISNPKYKL